MLRYTTDRARPGLVTFYDIWPGNGAGLALYIIFNTLTIVKNTLLLVRMVVIPSVL